MAPLLLSVDDLPRLYREYFSSRAQWKAIGCALGIGTDDLEAIDRDRRGICEDCFRELLLKWLRKRGEKTESELVEAIQDVYIDNKDVDASLLPNRLCIALIMILLSIVLAIPAVHIYRWFTASPLTSAAHTLKGLYRHHPVVEFELLDFVANMPYINVTMQRASTKVTVDFWELLNNLESKHMQLQATSQDKGDLERILITGHPGAGKTTLMRYLAKEWANGRRLQSCKVLFLFQFDCLSKEKEPQSLINLLQLSPYNDLDLEGLSKEIKQREGAGACFLLDSYDEWIWKKDFIHQLFFEFNLHFSLCILTSRPSTLYVKQSGIEYITMTGFKSANLELYLETLSTDTRVINSIISLWNSNHFIKEMCTLPLNMAMLISIVTNDENLVFNTKTEIYSAFMNVTVNHFIHRHPGWNTVSLWACILNESDSHSNNLCKAFTELHRVAFEMFVNQTDTFPDCEDVNRDIDKLGFVKITKVTSNGNKVRYTFYHPTFQEFFAAIHLLSLKKEELLYLYIYVEERMPYCPQINYNPWLYYFGLIGAYYREDIVSAILRQLSIYQRSMWIWDIRAPFRYDDLTFQNIQEIGWTGKKLDKLLESTGIVVNSTLYVSHYCDTLGYILNHATIQKLKIETDLYDCYGHNIVHLEDSKMLNTQFESVKSCLCFVCRKIKAPLAISSMTHLRYRLFGCCLNVFECLLKAAANLHSLHIHLVDDCIHPFIINKHIIPYTLESFSSVLASIKNLGKNLQILNFKFGLLYCGDLSPYVNFLMNISSKHQLIQELEIDIEPPHDDELVKCLSQLRLFLNEITHLHKLQKLTLTRAKKWISLDTSQDVLQKIVEMNQLNSLELHYVGVTGVQRLSWYFLSTLQELNLCENDITDTDIDIIAQGLKGLRDLRSLNLCRNSIQGGNLASLVEALTLQQNISSLDLSYNPMNDSGCIKALGSLRNLRHLNLVNSGVDVKVLVNVLLSNNITLHSLSVSENDGARSLLPLAQLIDLHHLDISKEYKTTISNKIPLDSDSLVVMLKNLTKLESIKLCDSSAELLWSINLARVISHHLPQLRLVHVPCLYVPFSWKLWRGVN